MMFVTHTQRGGIAPQTGEYTGQRRIYRAMPEITKALTDAIPEALSLGKSELNEACTCDWIIKPLLQAVGYSLYEIQPQQTDSAGKVPDYTILPGTEHTWFVEAKAWGVTLNDQHAQQAMIYAFTSNRRWVALTNGREWRLYDNTINGPLHGKLVADMHLEDLEPAAAFLRAIGRESMLNGGAEQFASKAQLAVILEHDLPDASSDIIKGIWTRLKTRPGLSSVTKEQVAKYFRGEKEPPPVIDPIVPPLAGSYGLDELFARSKDLIEFKSPASIVFPDGTNASVNKWSKLAETVVAWIADNHALPPLPFVVGKMNKRCFLNSQPAHLDPKCPNTFATIATSSKPLYMDKDYGGTGLIRQLCGLCTAVGADAGSIRVEMQG